MADFGDKLTNFNLKSYYKIKNIYKKVPSNKTKHVEGGKNVNELSEKVKLLSTKGYDCLLGRTYFTVNGSYENFLVFTLMLNSLISDNNKKSLFEYQLEYHLKKINHLILILP